MKTSSIYRRFGKRWLDIALIFVLLPFWFPLLGCAILAVRWRMGAPAIFRQQRPGRNGRLFVLFKLRTMTSDCDPTGRLLPDERRLTRLGRLLRATSVDELPQLWNVLRGDMALIGPRPLLVEYLPRYTEEQNRRHAVRPGITGWAQVNGRQDISFSKRLALDVWYVDRISFSLDSYIFWRSCVIATCGSGVRSGQNVQIVDDLGLHGDTRGQGCVTPPKLLEAPQQQADVHGLAKEASDDTDRRDGRAA